MTTAARLAPVLLAGGVAAIGGTFLARAGTGAAAEDGAFLVDPARIEIVERPAWLPPEWLDEIERTLGALGPFSIFDEAAPEILRAALAGLDWVEVVAEPRRDFPRAMRAVIRIRRPVAQIDPKGSGTFSADGKGARPLLVDAEGRLLPPASPGETISLDLPMLQAGTPPFAPPPRVGEAWPDPRVVAGAAAAADAAALRARTGIAVRAIDVSNTGEFADPTGSEIVFVAEDGARILWGRSTARAVYGERDPEEKAASLAQVLQTYPGLAGLEGVDLRFDEAVATLAGPVESP